MNELMNYNIVILGGNHHNGLGLARIFGLNGINVDAIIVDNCKKSFIRFSKYVKNCYCFSEPNLALDFVLSNYSAKKTIVIPYSDEMAYHLDMRLKDFDKYIVPSIKRETGEIAKMMEKDRQYEYAINNNIKMAYTEKIDISGSQNKIWLCEKYPCIIKPIISAEGDKKDITVCANHKELLSTINEFREKKYNRVLIQEYLKIDYEIDVFGCILKNTPKICMIPTKTIRSWPAQGGTNSFSQIITDKTIIEKCKKIINKLSDTGFYGLYDIELFVINDEIYLNEINYRNSGDVYMGINQGYYYPLAWVLDAIGIPYKIPMSPSNSTYAMTECADFRNVFKKNVKFNRWFKDYKKSKDFALKFKGDMKPVFNRYMYYVLKFFKLK